LNYDDIRAQFSGLLNRRDITTTLRDTFIQQALQRAQRLVRSPAMDRSLQVTINTETELSVPLDLIKLINLSTDQGRLRSISVDEALRIIRTEGPGVPRAFARRDAKWLLAPAPKVNQKIRIDYMSEFNPLVAGTDTNNLSVIAPDVLLYGALSYACDYFLDNRAAQFEARFQQAVGELNDMSQDDELSGGAAVSAVQRYEEDL